MLQIQAGSVAKTTPGSITVAFEEPFLAVPIVLLTPNYAFTVAGPDSVTDITETSFTITSNNSAVDYVLNWLAVSPGEFRVAAIS
jgi:hypothetical protein